MKMISGWARKCRLDTSHPGHLPMFTEGSMSTFSALKRVNKKTFSLISRCQYRKSCVSNEATHSVTAILCPMHERGPLEKVAMFEYVDGIPEAALGGEAQRSGLIRQRDTVSVYKIRDDQRTYRNSCASSPHILFIVFNSLIGMKITSLRSRLSTQCPQLVCHDHKCRKPALPHRISFTVSPFLSSIGSDSGITSSFNAWRDRRSIGACRRRVSRTTQS